MNLVESIFRGGFGLRADAGGAPAPWDDFWYQSVGGEASAAGMRVSPQTVKRLGAVIACVSARGKAMATLPCKIMAELSGGGSKVVSNHPLYDILYSRPNEIQTAYDFKYMMQAFVDLRGNAYALKVPGPRGPVDQLIPLHPDRVTVEVLKGSGRLRYRYQNPDTNQTDVYVQDEIFHLRDWSDSMAVGQSRISMALDPLGVALARQDYMANWLKNDARSGMVMTMPPLKTKEDEREFVKAIQAGGTGSNRGKMMVAPTGATVTNVSVTPVDAQLLEGHKASQVEVCNIFGVLPHVVGIDAGKSATFASTEQFNIMHAQQCVHPMVVMWEQAIARDLLISDYYFAKFSMASLLRGDNATRFAGYAVAIQNSWMCPDDVRALEDLNPIPNGEGKVFWRSANLLPLAQLEAPSKPIANSATAGGADSRDDDDASEDGADGDESSQARALGDPAIEGRLKLLALGSAERCVRKEVSAVRKMIDRKAGVYEVTEFYVAHARFVAEVFHMEAAAALSVKIACDDRAQQLSSKMSDEDDEYLAAAQVWVENLASTEPAKLAKFVVEGVR